MGTVHFKLFHSSDTILPSHQENYRPLFFRNRNVNAPKQKSIPAVGRLYTMTSADTWMVQHLKNRNRLKQ
jgi:hypothetical protein